MRQSSMKSIVTALTLATTLLAAAPVATARPGQGARNQQTSSRDTAREKDRFAVVRDLINRTLRRIANNGGTTVPIPAPSTGGNS